jgi:hypothetical protein
MSHGSEQFQPSSNKAITVWKAGFSLLLFAIFFGLLSSVAQSQTPAEIQDQKAGADLLLMIKQDQILARSVYDKLPKGLFAGAVNDLRGQIMSDTGLQVQSVLKDETWSREIANLQAPWLRYEKRSAPPKFTAMESTTWLINFGRTKPYVEDGSDPAIAVGILYDSALCDTRNWKYVYSGDASTSTWNRSDVIPPVVDPDPRGPSGSSARYLVSGTDRASKLTALYKAALGPSWQPLPEAKAPVQFAPMNEVLAGLSKDAVKGIFFYGSDIPNARGVIPYWTALLQASARRQLVRKYLGVSVPLIEIPYEGASPAASKTPLHHSITEQESVLSSYLAGDLDPRTKYEFQMLDVKLKQEIAGTAQ